MYFFAKEMPSLWLRPFFQVENSIEESKLGILTRGPEFQDNTFWLKSTKAK